MKNDIHPLQVILFEGKGSSPWQAAERTAATAALLDAGYQVTRITGGAAGRTAAELDESMPVVVLGRFGAEVPEVVDGGGRLEIATRNTEGLDAEGVFQLVEETRRELKAELNQPGTNGAWKPWFPVIDYDRCTNCMQCLSFCLFDVYGVDEEKRIQVQNNDNCKTNCPACSRVCPEVAIMFPKYSSGPINGEAVRQEDVDRESMKVDISSLLGGDIYSSLRNRSDQAKSRFSKERSPDKALTERKRCLTKLQQSGIIPAEVLAELDLESLPSPEEIQRKAKELAELRAQA